MDEDLIRQELRNELREHAVDEAEYEALRERKREAFALAFSTDDMISLFHKLADLYYAYDSEHGDISDIVKAVMDYDIREVKRILNE